jgi:integrase/recombinase XerC
MQVPVIEDRRDEAVIRTLADTGIRRNELLGMECKDLDLDLGIVNVLGKGRRIRQVPQSTLQQGAGSQYCSRRGSV